MMPKGSFPLPAQKEQDTSPNLLCSIVICSCLTMRFARALTRGLNAFCPSYGAFFLLARTVQIPSSQAYAQPIPLPEL